LGHSSSPPPRSRDASEVSFDFEERELDNGLRVVLHEDRAAPIVAVHLMYHVGSKDERAGRKGFAHLFEHLLFQGSQHVAESEHFKYIQNAGGTLNGSTWFDRTNYYETLPANCLELGLWLESDRLGYLLPAMTQDKLDNQRDVVMNERRQRVDNQPYGRAFERLQEMTYAEPHPYHWPILGYMEDIAAATLEDVARFFASYYVPNNAVLSLAGDFDVDHAFAEVDRYFGPIGAALIFGRCEPISSPSTANAARCKRTTSSWLVSTWLTTRRR